MNTNDHIQASAMIAGSLAAARYASGQWSHAAAQEVAKAYEQDPKEGAALRTAVNEQLSARDQASLNEHLDAILAGVALARGADRVRNTPQGLTDAQFGRTSVTKSDTTPSKGRLGRLTI